MTVSSRFVCRCPRRTGDSRGFAFVRYKYADEAQKAIDRLDGVFFFDCAPHVGILELLFLIIVDFLGAGRNVDGRNIMVQFAKYGPNAVPM
jgi:splicing factor, arginine/serine-rich 2